jgi:hypothetical protein
VGECENEHSHSQMNSHFGSFILGVGIPVDSGNFRKQLKREKPLALKSSLYHWKPMEVKMSKMGSHDPFGHLQHKLWPKKRSGVKLLV